MTAEEIKQLEAKQEASGHEWDELEAELSALIADETSGLGDLAKFSKNLSKKDSAVQLWNIHLEQLKSDLQNGGLVDFEWGERWSKVFGFEVIGDDIHPTLTPNGDAIIPINFWYNNQRRTKLLVLHIKDEWWENKYLLPNGENIYDIEISKEQFNYQLIHDQKGFHLTLA